MLHPGASTPAIKRLAARPTGTAVNSHDVTPPREFAQIAPRSRLTNLELFSEFAHRHPFFGLDVFGDETQALLRNLPANACLNTHGVPTC